MRCTKHYGAHFHGAMYSALQRLNHLSSLATTYVMVLFGLISFASFLAQPAVNVGKVDVKDLIVSVVRRTQTCRAHAA